MKKFIIVLFVLLCFNLYADGDLVINFMFSSGQQRAVWNTILEKFIQKHPDIKVKGNEVEQETYKRDFEEMLSVKSDAGDVFFWFAGEKLDDLVKKGLVYELSGFWETNNYSKIFTDSSISGVKINNKIFGLPLSYYQWGFYYNRSLFKKLNITTPADWEQFLSLCNKLKKNNLTPIALGTKSSWPFAGWFDYINLRLNGYQFHKDLMKGKISYKDDRVKNVFRYIKKLRDLEYFTAKSDDFEWDKILPFIYREEAAMILMGNFITAVIPPKMLENIGFFSFPQIKKDIGRYEEAPLDVLIVSNNGKNKKNALLFLKFIADKEIQSEINQRMGMISPNKLADLGDNYFINEGNKLLKSAAGITQFYDRDTKPEFSEKAMELMKSYLQNTGEDNLDLILSEIERIKQIYYKR